MVLAVHFCTGLSSVWVLYFTVEKLKSYLTLVAKEMQMCGLDLLTKLW